MNSKIILCKNIKMDKSYTNVLNYSENQMVTLCEQNQIASATDYSFLRQTNSIYVHFTYAQCLQANYIAFQNTDYSGKWFFAWIDEVIYKNDSNCELRYTVDFFSTWFSYWQAKPCFVNRHHVNNDTIGLHTIEENLNVGDVMIEGSQHDNSFTDYYWIAVRCAYNPSTKTNYDAITVYNKNIFGTPIFLFSQDDLRDLGLFIIAVNGDGHIDDLQDIFIIPDALVKIGDLDLVEFKAGDYDAKCYKPAWSNSAITFNTTINKHYNFEGFTPKNNKCYCYPYNYLLVTNNNR